MTDLSITPVSGTILVLVLLLCGRQFRQNWKAQEGAWVVRAWLYGIVVVVSFGIVAFVPLVV